MMSFSARIRPWFTAFSLAGIVVMVSLVASCDSERGVLDPGGVPEPSYEIADGSAVGAEGFEDVNPYFFFLPPLVANPGKPGDSDNTVGPMEVEIFECGMPIPEFTDRGRRICDAPVSHAKTGVNLPDVTLLDEVYQMEWDTDAVPVKSSTGLFYRVTVSFYEGSEGPFPLGHVDVQFGPDGKEVKNINQSGANFFGLKEGRTVPVNFRIEEGATTAAKHYEVVADLLTCLDDEGDEIIDCDVRPIVPERPEEQQLVVWATDEDTGREEPAAVVTFTPGSVPEGGLTAVVEYGNHGSGFDPPSPEIHDDLEIPPFISVELFTSQFPLVPYDTDENPLGGDGIRLAWCHDEDDESVDMSKYAIYKVDDGETVLLKTGPGTDCLMEAPLARASPIQDDRSFLGILKDGLSQVAESMGPEPLRAMHGGLNTEGPVRRLSEFGAVDATLAATVAGENGAVGAPTHIAIQARHPAVVPDDAEGYENKPIGGHPDGYGPPHPPEYPAGVPDFVGAEPNDLGIIDFVTVVVTGGPNAGATVSEPVFDPETGYYTISYVPTTAGTDVISVFMDTREDQYTTLSSEVVALPAGVDCNGSGIIDCDVEVLGDEGGVEEELTVWVDSRHPAAIVKFDAGAVPAGVTAVVKYLDPEVDPNYPPSPEIEDVYEIPPFISVDLYDASGEYTQPLDPTTYGAQITWCHDQDPLDHTLDFNDLVLYKVDDGQTVLLETGPGSACLAASTYPLGQAFPAPASDDQSFLGRIRDRLSRVAGVLKPEPLRAMHGGLNTEGPVRRLSDFGAVQAYGAGDDVSSFIDQVIEVKVFANHPAGVGTHPGDPIGGHLGEPFVGGAVDESMFLVGTMMTVVMEEGSANHGVDLSPISFNSADGSYMVSYEPEELGTDEFMFTLNRYQDQPIQVTSEVGLYPEVIVDPDTDGLTSGTVPTLADAVPVVESGGTILFADGDHIAEEVVVDKPVTIDAVVGATPVIQNAEGRKSIRVDGIADGVVTIQNLNFENNSPGPDPGVDPDSRTCSVEVEGLFDEVIIRNNTFTSTDGPLEANSGVRVDTASADGATVLIQENTFSGGRTGIVNTGIWRATAPDPYITTSYVTVHDNVFSGHSRTGVVFQAGGDGEVTDNEISDIGGKCIQWQNRSSGEISGNDLLNCGTAGAIRVFGGSVDVLTNTIEDATPKPEDYDPDVDPYHNAIRFSSGATGQVSGNIIDGCGWGACIEIGYDAVAWVRDNTMTAVAGQGTEIGIVGFGGYEPDISLARPPTLQVVSGNRILGAGNVGNDRWANEHYAYITSGVLVRNATVTELRDNEIENAAWGITLYENGTLVDGSDNTATYTRGAVTVGINGVMDLLTKNDFTDYMVSIHDADYTTTGDLSCNWWGDLAGPEPKVAFDDPNGTQLIYSPWANDDVAGEGTGSCTLGLPVAFNIEGAPDFTGQDGDLQVDSVNKELGYPARARLVNESSGTLQPLVGETVTFTFRDLGSSGTSVTEVTDSQGYAATPWTLGGLGGLNAVEVSYPSADPISFTALVLGQMALWNADSGGGWDDAVGPNDIDPGAHMVGNVSIASGGGVSGDAFYFPSPASEVNVQSRDGFFQGKLYGDNGSVPYNNNNFTISAWVKLDRGDHFRDYGKFIVGARTTLEVEPSYTPGTPGLFKIYLNGDNPGAGEHYNISSPTPMQLDCYHHVLATSDGTTLRSYLDGVLMGEGDLTGALWDPVKPDVTDQTITWANHFLGRQGGSFVGHMDDAALWNIALSETQISQIYADAPVGPADRCQQYALRGRVLYSTTGVEGIDVVVLTDGNSQTEVDRTATNEFGEYYFGTLDEGTYWVRAASPLPVQYNHSEVHQVTIGETPAYRRIQLAKQFSLTAPASGSTVTNLRPTLTWAPHPDAVEGGIYEIRMNERPGGGVQGDPVNLIDPTTTETSFTVNVDLEDGVTYRWHVDYREPDHRLVGVNEVDFEFTVASESTATLNVTVGDGQGGLLAGEQVFLDGAPDPVVTDGNGLATFLAVSIGVHSVEVAGYAPQQVTVGPAGSTVEYYYLVGCIQSSHASDGVICGAEWDGATYYDITVDLLNSETTPARLYVANDDENIHFAVEFFRDMGDHLWLVVPRIDENNNGVHDLGEDEFKVQFDSPFWDYHNSGPGQPRLDTSYGGTNDGSAGYTSHGSRTVAEVSHPLRSGDPYDMYLQGGNEIGFQVAINVGDLPDPPVSVDNEYPGTGFYSYTVSGGSPWEVLWEPMITGTTTHLRATWGAGDSEIYAAGDDGEILAFDGVVWSPSVGSGANRYDDMWGFVETGGHMDQVYAVGHNGQISTVSGFGGAWTTMNSYTSNDLWGVWGTAYDNVFAVGQYGTILHYDGVDWQFLDSQMPTTSLHAVWGSSSSDVFVVGSGGAILHYAGGGGPWTPMTSGTLVGLWSVWGTSSTDVYAAGEGGTLLHYDGNGWTPIASGTSDFLFDIQGTSSADIFAVGGEGFNGRTLRSTGGAWRDVGNGLMPLLYKLWGTPTSDMYAVGIDGTILRGIRR